MASLTFRRAYAPVAATIALVLAFAGLSVATAPAAEAAPAPAFDCTEPRFFAQAGGAATTQLNTGSYNAQGQSVWEPIGPQVIRPNLYNALGFNRVDEYLYGTQYNDNVGQFVRVDRFGTVTNIGNSNPPLGTTVNTLWDSGEFDADGTYYVASGNQGGATQSNIRKVTGLAGATATSTPRPALTTVTLTPKVAYADFTFKDGFLWAANYGQSPTIYRIDVNGVLATAGTVTAFLVPTTVLPTSSYGSAFTMTNGNLAFIATNGFMHQISVTGGATASPQFERINSVTAPPNSYSDATNCATAEPSSLSVTKTGPATVVVGGEITWTVTVKNDGDGITSGFVLTDVLPTGLSNISVTSTDSACLPNAAQTIVTCNGGRLAVGQTAVVYVSATAPNTTGPLFNSAQVIGNEDPDPDPAVTAETQVVLATVADQPVTVSDPAATSWDNPSQQGGTVGFEAGIFTYTPPIGFSGFDLFTYQTPGGTVTVHVHVSPLAAPDSLTTTVNVPAPVSVQDLIDLGTGTDLRLDEVGNPVNGTLEIVDDEVVFTPTLGFSGVGTFEYTLVDADGLTVTDVVTVTVLNVFTPGTAVNTGVSTPQNTPAAIPLATIVTPSGAALNPAATAQTDAPSHGTLSINPVTGAVTYTPTAGYTGTDEFELQVCDVNGDCTTVVIEVTVGLNTVTANPDSRATPYATPVNVDVRANDDSDSGQSFANPTVTTVPGNGGAVVQPNGTITYTPDAGFSGVDTFVYEVCDTSTPTAVCDSATVTITVENAFTPGDALTDGVSTPQNTPVTIPLTDIVTPSGAALEPTETTLTDGPSNGTVTIHPVTGAVTYTPNTGFTGTDEFELEICDVNGDCTTVVIEVQVSANSVAATNDSESTPVDTAVTVAVLDNDTTASGQPFGLPTVTAPPSNGTVVIEADGTITYTPNAGFSGVDTFVYEACDTSTPTAICDSATVTITVTNVFVLGSAAGSGGTTTGQDQRVTIALGDIVTTTGAALDPQSVVVLDAPDNGTVSYNPLTGEFGYVPDDAFSGADEFTISVCDLSTPAQCLTITLGVSVAYNVVAAGADSAVTAAGEPVTIDVNANDTSRTGRPLGLPVITVQPANGEVTVLSDGRIRYTPAPGFAGTDTFEYERCDDSIPVPVCATATVTVEVRAFAVTGAEGVAAAIAAALGAGILGLLLLLVSRRRVRPIAQQQS